jgi:hypothetical protein
MYGMEVSFKVSALKNKIFISWLVVVLVLYVYKHYRHIMTGKFLTPSALSEGFFLSLINNELKCSSDTSNCTLSLTYGTGTALILCYKSLFLMSRWFNKYLYVISCMNNTGFVV